ncbi:hypothetical protein E8E13_005706 [Curvularia kusanoi]|uniref:NADP-dependent oxidoreductase domain-containing protein n=1 Tax=Curvularia kusanoi TaxID=90978 RepID=A0A9P4T9A1_CURKU|nr:hypothetical protein E8E13_005706 [Curvularia kusanoi]
MQHVLQAGLSTGMSATDGIHTGEHVRPNPARETHPRFDGLASVIPENQVPSARDLVTYRGKYMDDRLSASFPAIQQAWQHCFSKGVNFIDNAQAYGTGESEAICGRLFKGMKKLDFVIHTKYFVIPQLKDLLHPKAAPLKKLEGSLERLGVDSVDIYLVHGPIHIQSISTVAKGMAECVEKGLTKCVGVANYSLEDMLQFAEELAKYNVPLALNQCEFSVLRRLPELSGMIQACKDRGIVFQSYSSLAQGRLSGKYNAQNPPPKEYRFSSYDMKEIDPIVALLRTIGQRHGVGPAAVALNYNMCKGATPLVGIRRPEQAEQDCAALEWRLSNREIREIDEVSFAGHATKMWQQG